MRDILAEWHLGLCWWQTARIGEPLALYVNRFQSGAGNVDKKVL